MNRKNYTLKELAYIDEKIIPYYEALVSGFVKCYDFDAIVYGNAMKKCTLMSDLLCQEITNSVAFAQVGGLPVNEAVNLCKHNLNNRFTLLQLDRVFLQ
jgi:hypothetical protein